MKTPVLETKRVILRPLSSEDAQDIYDRWTSDDRVSKYVRWCTHSSVEDTRGWLKMVEENVKNASTAEVGEFTTNEDNLLKEVVKAINEKMKVGCTGCGYCMPCPKKVDIPGTFSAYNKRYTDGRFTALKEYAMCTILRKDSASASNGIDCGKCEKHCPQRLTISEHMRTIAQRFEGEKCAEEQK